MENQLEAIGRLQSPQERVEKLESLISCGIHGGSSLGDAKMLTEHLLQESLGLVTSRSLLNRMMGLLKELVVATTQGTYKGSLDLSELLEAMLEQTTVRATAFEEQISTTRELLADLAEAEGSYTKAADFLSAIPLESGHRQVSNDYKLQIYLRISRLHLEEDPVKAEAYLNRAGFLVHPETTDQVTQLQFKAAQARLLDFKRMFLPAASKYFDLSMVSGMHDSERNAALKAAVTCTLLAGAGPQRNKMLATLYKDERLRTNAELAESGHYAMLEKMVRGHVLQPKQVEEFSESLMEHQVAKFADGSTVLDRAVMEHNLLSISNLFVNISFQQLASLLSISASQAESVAATMMCEGRLKGKIDQVDSIIHFDQPSPLESWNKSFATLCENMDNVIQEIEKKYPDWIAGQEGIQ